MSASVTDIRRQLCGHNPSDGTYRRLLQELLTHQDLKTYIHGLQEADLQGFVELLDEALNRIPATEDLFSKTLRRLQSICSNRGILPSSYLIPSENLSKRPEPIAPGDFGDAFEADLDGKKACIKTLRSYAQDTSGDVKRIFYREVIVWKRLQHPNIVPFLGVPTKIPPPYEIVFDWMENGTLIDFVAKHPEVDRIGLLWDITDGLHFLHSCKIIHGNLKGVNVLIDKNNHARLTDFGLASVIREENSTLSPQDRGAAGTTAWAAPEILKGGTMSKEGDVFTLAMVAVETFTGHPPFTSSYQSALYSIMTGKRPQRPGFLSDDGLWEIVQRCWDQRPEKRPTMLELVEFFQLSFPGGREIPKAQAIPSTLSTWSLADPEVYISRTNKPRTDPNRQEMQDEPGPADPSTGSLPGVDPELPTTVGRHPSETDPPEQGAGGGPPGHDGQRVPEKGVPTSANDRAASSSLLRRLRNALRTVFTAIRKIVPRGRALNKGRPT
ncbi:kinase-like domain-containing protein [Thelephora terrestris]|uniref:Kinase-like domain-containing protein n=1 Tax=Thelephora terrestris TaxID=56493 RepID=A0A9P6HML1_9AGAM|nr:kinase-like domain-containing protein [Thelephora terrestris]